MSRLRYYQMEAVDAIRACHEQHRSTACVMPTGTGKTEVYLSLAVEEPLRTLVLVHRDYLITSPVARLQRAGFSDVAIEKAMSRAERGGRRAQIVFASVQSIGPESRAARLRTFDPKEFGLLIIDEGHRAPSATYRRVQEYFEAGNPKLKTLILTATPKRKDGIALGNVCDSVAYEMTPAQAAAEGWIVPPRFFVRDVPELDFSKIDLRGQDLNADQMAELLVAEEPLHKLCASLAEDQGPTIVFCPKVAVAQAYAIAMSKRYRYERAVAIHEGSTDEECERATKGLADGSIDYVFNVDKLTEGYDVPRVVRVAWAAPTASLVRWTQGCGRGFRPDASIARHLLGGRDDAAQRRLIIEQSAKPYCSIVTYHPSNCRHQICSAVDLLGGKDLPEDVQRYAEQTQRETARQLGGSDTPEDIKTATLFADLRAAANERYKHIKAKAQVADSEYDGMGGPARTYKDAPKNTAKTPEAVAESWGSGNPPTPGQIGWLSRQGVPREILATLTKQRAYVVGQLADAGLPLLQVVNWSKGHAMREFRERGLGT